MNGALMFDTFKNESTKAKSIALAPPKPTDIGHNKAVEITSGSSRRLLNLIFNSNFNSMIERFRIVRFPRISL